jgi:NTE family protein
MMPQQNDQISLKSKLGLALSGGGFRAALFHIGVLARLAELDLLRKIDVISSVSGGSIIAAYYYLKVKALLENGPRDNGKIAPDRADYIRMVEEIETDFLAAVQKNMRMRMVIDPGKTARMLGEDYSNTERLAELFTDYFYKPLLQEKSQAQNNMIPLKSLPIEPKAGSVPAESKIPFLILNATTLNTGHLWQFTNVSVGEQPTGYITDHEPIGYLNKFRMDDERLTIEQRKILYNVTLGQAVAASCCVPGILVPLRIKHLYKMDGEPLTVRLVDGGLVDNQGLASLFAENCTHIICSDASDILKPEPDPSAQILTVARRANDILMDRIRNKSVNELYKFEPNRQALIYLGDQATRHDIFPADSQKIVRAISRIRTDLDSFSDREAFSLMCYGYELSGKIIQANGFEMTEVGIPDGAPDWKFLEIRDRFLADDKRRNELLLHLDVGSHQMFKVFLLNKPAPYFIAMPLPVIIFLLLLFLIVKISPRAFWILMFGVVIIMIYTQNARILQLMDNATFLRRIKHRILKTMLSLRLPEPFSYLLAIASWIHLAVFDRLFLRYGRIKNDSDKRSR